MVKFGERVKKLRLSAGMTQEQLAERIWVTKAAISNYELSERNPSPETIIKIAGVFGVTTDYLLGLEDKRSRHIPQQLSQWSSFISPTKGVGSIPCLV